MVEETKTSIFQRPAWVVVFALTAAMAWGWAYPLIKLGFGEFGITGEMTGSKMLFAGIRFALVPQFKMQMRTGCMYPRISYQGNDLARFY